MNERMVKLRVKPKLFWLRPIASFNSIPGHVQLVEAHSKLQFI